MFVKIKYEPGNGKPNIFALDDNATIQDLKIKMESIIDIPAECQEIHTLSTSLDNGVVLSTMVEENIKAEKMPINDYGVGINGAAISLYSSNKFICFLQFYNEIEGDIQGNFFNQTVDKDGKTRKLLPIDQVPQYFETIDTDDSCLSTNTNSSHSSYSSSDSSESSGSDNETNSSPLGKRKSTDDAKSTSAKRTCSSSAVVKFVESKTPMKVPKDVVLKENAGQTPKDCSNFNELAPYVSVSPEYRHFILVITTDSPKRNFSALMGHFYGLFETSKNCDRLKFSENHSVAEFNDKLWLTCGDKVTCDWITQSLVSLNEYQSYEYIEYFHLKCCMVVLPEVVKHKDLFSVFQLLELQNCGLNTDTWCVVDRQPLLATTEDYNEKVVTHICDNEELTLWMNAESVEFIKKHDLKLKYCFWRLTFVFR